MSENTKKFLKAVSVQSGIKGANAMRVKPIALEKGDLVLFRDPRGENFPHNDPEIGIVALNFKTPGIKTGRGPEVGALVVMPVTKINSRVDNTATTLVISQPDQKMAMKLNPNSNYRVGSAVEHRGKLPAEEKVRILPIAWSVFDLDKEDCLHKLGACPPELWAKIDRHFTKMMRDNNQAAAQLAHDVKQTYLHRDDMRYFRHTHQPYDFNQDVEVVKKSGGPKGGTEPV